MNLAPGLDDVSPRLQEHIPLSDRTTLGLGGAARWFVEAQSEEHLAHALSWATEHGLDAFVLGGGSNLVVADAGFDGLVIKVAWNGCTFSEQDDKVLLTAAAGESWDSVVRQSVERNLAGFECLAGIPGLVGATPIQNVGAYGQEVSDTIVDVRVLDHHSGETRTLARDECGFAYRDSMFKRTPGRFVVLSVSYLLSPGGDPLVRYGELERHLKEQSIQATVKSVSEAVVRLRRRKGMVLDPHDPDSRSAGSFFTNPILSAATASQVAERAIQQGLAKSPSDVPQYPQPDGRTKLAAGWLIEKAGIQKGFRRGDALRRDNVGVSSKHALALIHHGSGSTTQLLDLARFIRDRVQDRFAVTLHPEPNLLGVEF